MILKCECVNSTADAIHGKGVRPHIALVKFCDRPTPRFFVKPQYEEYLCQFCGYVRTMARGLQTGKKGKTQIPA